jgi:hypothetical protein
MPSYQKYTDGRFAAPNRSVEVEDALGFQGITAQIVRNEDPLIAEAEENEKRMSSHWARPELVKPAVHRRKESWKITL